MKENHQDSPCFSIVELWPEQFHLLWLMRLPSIKGEKTDQWCVFAKRQAFRFLGRY